jgi:DnaJ-class molecular chaperone
VANCGNGGAEMTIKGYDDWKLRGPDEERNPCDCPDCKGTGVYVRHKGDEGTDCNTCGGWGVIDLEPEEPDGDYEYERRRDAIMDRG